MLENHWYILGAGSIGSLFSCMLQQANIDTTLLLKPTPENLSISLQNIQLTQRNGSRDSFFIPAEPAHDNQPPCTQPPITQLLLTTKAHQSIDAIHHIRARLTEDAIIVILQNGMGVGGKLQRLYPYSRIMAATTTEGVHRADKTHITHAGSGETWIGPLDSAKNNAELTTLAQCIVSQWRTTVLSVSFDPNILHRLWTKLAINCAINPLTVLYQCKNGELLHHPDALHTMSSVCKELESIMDAQHIPHQHNLFDITKNVAKNTQHNISSMLQDYRAGRTTEISYINGYVIEEGKRLGISTPINQQLVNDVIDTIN